MLGGLQRRKNSNPIARVGTRARVCVMLSRSPKACSDFTECLRRHNRPKGKVAFTMEDGIIRQYEPTYRLKPHDELKCDDPATGLQTPSLDDVFTPCRFSPSAVRKAAEEVIRSVLEDKVWNGEDEAVWTVTITEQVKQRVRGTIDSTVEQAVIARSAVHPSLFTSSRLEVSQV